MGRDKGADVKKSSFEPKIKAPLDSRLLAGLFSDLISSSAWEDENGDMWVYEGMTVTVKERGLHGVYMLLDPDNYADIASWELIAFPEKDKGKHYLRYKNGATAASIKSAIETAATGGNKHIVISDVVDGGGLTWTLPTGTIIDIARSGLISNVTIDGDYEILKKSYYAIGTDVTFSGTPKSSVVNPIMWGAIPNVDSASKIQSMLDFVDLAKCGVDWKEGGWKLESALNAQIAIWTGLAHFYASENLVNKTETAPNGNHLVNIGVKRSLYGNHLNFKQKYTTASEIFTISGYRMQEGQSFIKLDADVGTDINNLNIGDILMLWCTEPTESEYATDTNFKGEMVKIYHIDYVDRVITIHDTLEHSYDTPSYNVSVTKLDMNKVSIENISIVVQPSHSSIAPAGQKSTNGLYIGFVEGLWVGKCNIVDAEGFGFHLQNIYGGTVDYLKVVGCHPLDDALGYSTEFAAPNKDVTFLRYDAYGTRHVVDAYSHYGGYGVSSNIQILSGNWVANDARHSFQLFNPHGAMKNVKLSNIKFNGTFGIVAEKNLYNAGTTYAAGDMVASDQAFVDTDGAVRNRFFISLQSGNVGQSLSDGAYWRMIFSTEAYRTDIPTWDGTPVNTGDKVTHLGICWEARADSLSTEPSISAANWVIDYTNRTRFGVRLRGILGYTKVESCEFINLKVCFGASEGQDNNLYIKNCSARYCQAILSPSFSGIEHQGTLEVDGFESYGCGGFINMPDSPAASPEKFPSVLRFRNLRNIYTPFILHDNPGYLPDQVEEILIDGLYAEGDQLNITHYFDSMSGTFDLSANSNLKLISVRNVVAKDSQYPLPIVRNLLGASGFDYEISNSRIHFWDDSSYGFWRLCTNKLIIKSSKIICNSKFSMSASVIGELHLLSSDLVTDDVDLFRYTGLNKLVIGEDSSLNISVAAVISASSKIIQLIQYGNSKHSNYKLKLESYSIPEGNVSAPPDSECKHESGINYIKRTGTGNTGWGIVQGTGSDLSALTTYTLDVRKNRLFAKTIDSANSFNLNIDGYAEDQFFVFTIRCAAGGTVSLPSPMFTLSTGTATTFQSASSLYDNTLATQIEVGVLITATGASITYYVTSV